MKKVGLGKNCVDGSMLITDDIYGGAIPEGAKGNIFKYKVTGFYKQEEEFNMTYSAQAIKESGFAWIDFQTMKV